MADKSLKEVGVIAHYYAKIGVAIVELKKSLSVGDKILIRGSIYPQATNLEQIVESMQIEHKSISSAKSGQSIGLKVNDLVRKKDKVYIIS